MATALNLLMILAVAVARSLKCRIRLFFFSSCFLFFRFCSHVSVRGDRLFPLHGQENTRRVMTCRKSNPLLFRADCDDWTYRISEALYFGIIGPLTRATTMTKQK